MNISQWSLALIAVLLVFWAFFGFIKSISKNFQGKPSSSLSSSNVQSQQKQIADDTKEKQQKLMDDLKQRISDHHY